MDEMQTISVEDAFKQQMAMMGVSHFSWWSLLAAFVFGIVGFYVCRAGWRKSNKGMMAAGIAMMVYPAFTNGAIMDWTLGIFLCAVAYYFHDRGESNS